MTDPIQPLGTLPPGTLPGDPNVYLTTVIFHVPPQARHKALATVYPTDRSDISPKEFEVKPGEMFEICTTPGLNIVVTNKPLDESLATAKQPPTPSIVINEHAHGDDIDPELPPEIIATLEDDEGDD